MQSGRRLTLALAAATLAVAATGMPASAGGGGLVVSVTKQCRVSDVELPQHPATVPYTVQTTGTYAAWALVLRRDGSAPVGDGGLDVPGLFAGERLLAGSSREKTHPAGTYQLVVCSDGTTTVRITLPTRRLSTPKGRARAGLARVYDPRTLGVQASMSRTPLPKGNTVQILGVQIGAGSGFTAVKMCVRAVDPCSKPPDNSSTFTWTQTVPVRARVVQSGVSASSDLAADAVIELVGAHAADDTAFVFGLPLE